MKNVSLPEGIDRKIGEHGGKLSGEGSSTVSIARALMRDPKVIILDEATSALDSISEKEIQNSLVKFEKEYYFCCSTSIVNY